MTDLESPQAIWAKGILFLLLGIGAAVLLLLESPGFRTAILLGVVIWAFCRAYYFAFYVINHYVDPGYKFSGLGSFVRHLLRQRRYARKPKQNGFTESPDS